MEPKPRSWSHRELELSPLSGCLSTKEVPVLVQGWHWTRVDLRTRLVFCSQRADSSPRLIKRLLQETNEHHRAETLDVLGSFLHSGGLIAVWTNSWCSEPCCELSAFSRSHRKVNCMHLPARIHTSSSWSRIRSQIKDKIIVISYYC